jgi:TonB family protein
LCDRLGAIFKTWRCFLRNLTPFIAFLAILALSDFVRPQQPPLAQSGSANATPNTPSPDKDGFYKQTSGIVAPVLVRPIAVVDSHGLVKNCAPRTVVISAVITANGAAGVQEPQQATDPNCESAAIDAIERSGFEAGKLNDRPVPVLVCLGVSFLDDAEEILPRVQPCPENLGTTTFDGRSVYRVGGAVKVPVVTSQPIAKFSDEARRKHYQGACVLGLVVDTQGHPQNVNILRALGMGLDEKAMEAVRGYRFKPATLSGIPVPVSITVEIDFHLYKWP